MGIVRRSAGLLCSIAHFSWSAGDFTSPECPTSVPLLNGSRGVGHDVGLERARRAYHGLVQVPFLYSPTVRHLNINSGESRGKDLPAGWCRRRAPATVVVGGCGSGTERAPMRGPQQVSQ